MEIKEKMKLHIFAITILFFSIVSCTKNGDPIIPEQIIEGDGNLLITVNPAEYSFSNLNSGNVLNISAILSNQSDKVYYAEIGDFYNSSTDQDNIYIAGNTQAFVEMFNSDDIVWKTIFRSFLIEGSRFVSIKPAKMYYLHGCIPHNEKYVGKYRIKINYYNKIEPTAKDTLFEDYSNIFDVIN